MTVTVRIEDDRHVRVAEDRVETDPPDRLAFTIEGAITLSEEVLGRFAGTTLQPARIGFSIDGSRTVDVDLTAEPSIRLSAVDVGVATPDADDLVAGLDALESSLTDPEALVDARPSVLAFTVEGSISDVSEETVDALSDGDPTVAVVSFAVGGRTRSDGGSPEDVLLEIRLFGYGVTVRRDAAIVVGSRGSFPGIDLL